MRCEAPRRVSALFHHQPEKETRIMSSRPGLAAFLPDRRRKRSDAIEVTDELARSVLSHTDTRKPGGTFPIKVRPSKLTPSVTDE
jgi:hypothetical protein